MKNKDSEASIIRVDRSIIPAYPDLAVLIPRHDLEKKGLVEYSIEDVGSWAYGTPKDRIPRSVVYGYLKRKRMLNRCLGFEDGLEIQKKGVEFFRKYFDTKLIELWRTFVMWKEDGNIYTPVLFENASNEMFLTWYSLEWNMEGNSITPLFN